jgi:hypothetical protein
VPAASTATAITRSKRRVYYTLEMSRLAAALVLLAGCGLLELPSEDLFSDDVPDDQTERLTDAEVAAEEAASGESPIPVPAEGAYDWDASDSHAARINLHRTSHGADTINRSSCLDAIARRWARRMASGICGNEIICHRSENGPSGIVTQVERCWDWARIGENVGTSPLESEMFQFFLDSPPHHANIDKLWNNDGAGKFGIGVFRRTGDDRLFLVHVFAARR